MPTPAPVDKKARKARAQKAPVDRLDLELLAGEHDAAKELRLIMDAVRISQFIDLEPPITVPDFLKLRNLAMMRRWWGLSDAQVAARLDVTLERLAVLEVHPHYQAIRDAIEASGRAVQGMISLENMAEAAEGRVAKEQLLMATSSGSPREKLKALDNIADRRMPKKSRAGGTDGLPQRSFPEDMLKLIEVGLKLGQEFEARRQMARGDGPVIDAESHEIDAGVLNVPGVQKLLGEGNKPS